MPLNEANNQKTLNFREMQIKPTIRYHFICTNPLGWLELKNQIIPRVVKDVEKLEHLEPSVGM